MTAMNNCPYCQGGWKRWNDLSCDECSGRNSRRSYDARTSTLAANLFAAVVEEMRFRAFARRLNP